jgi:type I restriction enzyme M protein
VDTFEEEEPVDLEAISQELKQLNQDIKEVDQEIESYCQELNLNTPF